MWRCGPAVQRASLRAEAAVNGIHDMGGLHGFGRVEVEPDEPVFHARWEERVFGIVTSLPAGNIDAGRHGLERLDPVSYLQNGYYGRWLAALERGLLARGVLTAGEIEARMREPVPRVTRAAAPRWKPLPRPSYARAVERAPRFREGEAVRTGNHQPEGHTRLPAYARCRLGEIERAHPAMVYPDDHAHGRGEKPQYLYTVRFAARELWGPEAEPDTAVYLDLFEPYLEPA
jgi:nitrile hydratase beta subunit